ncbi:hypothetical protein DFH07DRAFT_812129 [Mycena maculata]|uniref:F-box domain-containing protein n=1 Tax=Mycena maculata TaxID=230809 RepID=A0AAD7JIJ2_9AGAR|nr:hypothetical protein DFH07DRAFT_812129 [Mycena maculata]
MAGDPPDFGAMYDADLKQRTAQLMRENPGISPEAAVKKAEAVLRANNPFIPPTHGCPVNDLPPELLAHIFQLGRKMDEEDDDEYDEYDEGVGLQDEWTDEEDGDSDADEEEEEEDEDVHMESPEKRTTALPEAAMPPDDSDEDEEEEADAPDLAFQVLVSHVCHAWREIALGTHTLWTTLQFGNHLNVEKAQAWLERAQGLPLDIYIDCTTVHGPDHDAEDEEMPPPTIPQQIAAAAAGFGIVLSFTSTATPDDAPQLEEPQPQPCIPLEDLIIIMDMITPHVQQWRLLEITVNYYSYMYEVLKRLALCPAAPLLEELGLYSYDETEEYETFQPADLATPFLPFHGIAPRLNNVALWGVHLAWDESLSLLQGLRELELAYHAKDVRPSFAALRAILDASPEIELLSLCLSGTTSDMEPFEVPSLRSLVLCYLESEYAKPFMRAVALPTLQELTLDLQEEDYTEFVTQLATPPPGETRSLLSKLTTLKLSGLPCSKTAAELVMSQLSGLQRIDLNAAAEEELRFFELLQQVEVGKPVYCPKLDTLRIAGVDGAAVRKLVAARKAAAAPVTRVLVSNRDFVDPKDEKWLRANVDELEFFEPSDSEEEVVDADDEMDEDDGS